MAFEAEKPSHLKQVCSTIVLAVVAIALPALFAGRLVGAPMGTALTYQGQLQQSGSGNITGQPQSGPVTGICDFRFSLWDAVTNGNLVGATQTNSAVSVSNGLFTVTLDFGAGAFNGDARWLDIGVRTSGGGAFTNLFPRQLVPLAPYALYAAEAGSVAATNFIGIVPDAQLSSNVALLNGNANFIDAVTAASFAGNGSGLTNLNAANLTGILPLSNLNPAVVTNRYGDSQDTFYISTNGVAGGSIFLGIYAGNFPQPESFGNIGIGANAMRWTTTNDVANIAIGPSALQNGTNRSLSIAVGGYSLASLLKGKNVTALGFGSGGNVLSATNSIYIGNFGVDGDYGVIRIGQDGTNTDTYIAGIIHGNGSGLTNLNAADLTGILSLSNLNPAVLTNDNAGEVTIGNNLDLINGGAYLLDGSPALFVVPTVNPYYASYYGGGAGNTNSTGNSSVGFGVLALGSVMSGSANTAYGWQAGANITNGSGNTFIGYLAGLETTSGHNNVGSGSQALRDNTSGSYNVSAGDQSMFQNTIGSLNTVAGQSALYANTTGSNNVALGPLALLYITNGQFNIGIGRDAGTNLPDNATNVIIIGNVGTPLDTNIIRIGNLQSDAYIAGIIHGNGSGLTNVPGIGSATNAINNNNGVGTNLTVYGTLTSTNLNALYDTNNAGIAAALAATNNFGNSIAVTMTNATNQFTGTFTNGTYYGNGSGLTNLPAGNIVGTLTNNAATSTYAITAGTATNAAPGGNIITNNETGVTLGGTFTNGAYYGNGVGLTNLQAGSLVGTLNNVTIQNGTFGGDLTYTNQVAVFTNTTSPQNIDLGALIHSLPQVPNNAAGFGGGKIQLGPGTYFTSTTAFSATSPFMLELCGSAFGQTAIVFTNMTGGTSGLSLETRAGSHDNYLSVYIHDLYLCTTADNTSAILSITNTARDTLQRLVFCPWAYATNAYGNAGGNYGRTANQIGLLIQSTLGEETILDDVGLAGLWVGAAIGADHLRVHGYLGIENCGANYSVGGSSAAWGVNVYSVGGGLFLNSSLEDVMIEGMHSFNTMYPIIDNEPASTLGWISGQILILGGDNTEFGQYRSLVVYTNGIPLVYLFNHKFLGGGHAEDGILQFNGSSWSVINQSPPNIIEIYQDGLGNDISEHFAIGGNDVMVISDNAVTAEGNFVGDGSGLTNSSGSTFLDYNFGNTVAVTMTNTANSFSGNFQGGQFQGYSFTVLGPRTSITVTNAGDSILNGTYVATDNTDTTFTNINNYGYDVPGAIYITTNSSPPEWEMWDPDFHPFLVYTNSALIGTWHNAPGQNNSPAPTVSMTITNGTFYGCGIDAVITNGTFYGNGSGLTNIPAGSLVGTLTNATTGNANTATYAITAGTATNSPLGLFGSAATNSASAFDTNNAGIAAALAATNNFGTTVPVNMTNALNSFTGTFTNGTYYGNGIGLTNLNATNLVGTLTNNTTGNAGSATTASGGWPTQWPVVAITNANWATNNAGGIYAAGGLTNNETGVTLGGTFTNSIYYGNGFGLTNLQSAYADTNAVFVEMWGSDTLGRVGSWPYATIVAAMTNNPTITNICLGVGTFSLTTQPLYPGVNYCGRGPSLTSFDITGGGNLTNNIILQNLHLIHGPWIGRDNMTFDNCDIGLVSGVDIFVGTMGTNCLFRNCRFYGTEDEFLGACTNLTLVDDDNFNIGNVPTGVQLFAGGNIKIYSGNYYCFGGQALCPTFRTSTLTLLTRTGLILLCCSTDRTCGI
jgi:hypothetical protein